ncbi:DIS3-like exonuclease 1 [Octopus sinensis]|uniref:DIS3-like exonuclease 1 n=1 Tax=Octopus sinensis TaxID=2607531 RepID=A0A6P7T6U9_9MOLL|nr:DIS3-like exonuclease 1 [Octopus sinensis]XP_036365776.1 DIS3-like exonuclease 1 [Octopus sinensis]
MTAEESDDFEKAPSTTSISQISRINRQFRLKSNRKSNIISMVQELYLRKDVPCKSLLCQNNCTSNKENDVFLSLDVSHYVVLDSQICRDYLEIWETPEIKGIIFPQTIVNSVQYEGNSRQVKRLKALLDDPRKGSVLFCNEFHEDVYCERQPKEPTSEWQTKCCYKVSEWYYNHLNGQMPIIMVTDNTKMIEEYGCKTLNVFVLSMEDYMNNFWEELPGIIDLYASLRASLDSKQKGTEYLGYLPMHCLESGVKTGLFIKGHLNVNKHDAQREAFLQRSSCSDIKSGNTDILIHGMPHRNRAIHGDLVVVELLPKSEWRGRSMCLNENNQGSEDEESDMSTVMPNGKVVGIIQRNSRDYAASLVTDENMESEGKKNPRRADRVLAIPWDYRIPKIRISTRQIENLRDQRFVVRIDSWELGSQYPNGHFVRTLGPAGDPETEIATILVENNIFIGNFSDSQLQELPKVSPENPWEIPVEESSKRRDLRKSHLVFSIDPPGCEDVDDTLSVRHLPDGHIELGVHIADVTFFVKPGSLSDLEARGRSTTVYLADRRYDMLPSVLSSNLCSLVSGEDKCSVSVMWEMDASFNVLDVWYGRTLINSSYKLTYETAQALADGATVEEASSKITELETLGTDKHQRVEELRVAIRLLMEIAFQLKAERKEKGALDLDGLEVRPVVDEKKNISELIIDKHLEVHDTVAECMILANEWVARKISSTFINHALLRHHPLPRQEFFQDIIDFAKVKNFTIDTSSNKSLADSLDRCVDPNDIYFNKLLRMMAVLAMPQSLYFSTGSLNRDNFFHYGLALDVYTHFTSPIRRYADILVHHQLLSAIGEGPDDYKLPGNEELQKFCDHINMKHRAAQNAQRDSQKMFQALYFKDKSFDKNKEDVIAEAIVIQLRSNGVLVFVPRFGLKGPVYLKDKQDKVVEFSAANQKMEWGHGSITRGDNHVTVISRSGKKMKFTLLQHITVIISLELVNAHQPNVKLELLSDKPILLQNQNQTDLKNVFDKLSKKDANALSADEIAAASANSFTHLNTEYRQSEAENSLYEVFESFQEMGIMSV